MSIKVKSTREGLVGQKTATGWIIDKEYPFVALPSAKALNRWVKITNPANGRFVCAQVLDVGPWNEHDDEYVFNGARPAAESGTSVSGHGTNAAGIDLGEKVWSLLGMTGNTDVEWEFV
jgi:hypothetical protein